jgi:hypothetical protein
MVLRDIVWEDMDWMNLARYRHQWQAVVNMLTYLQDFLGYLSNCQLSVVLHLESWVRG